MNMANFEQIRDYIYSTSGIFIENSKKYFLDRKVMMRMDELDFDDFNNYYRYLIFDSTGQELDHLLDAVTVNETSFFRDYYQLSCFAEDILPKTISAKKACGDRNLRILSVGCATGEEPYTLAIILKEMLDYLPLWRIDIAAFDINTQVLDAACGGIYDARSTRDIPISYKVKYFKLEGGKFALKNELKKMVTMSHGNLADVDFMNKFRRMDFVFCRNVLIYFNEESKKRAIATLYDTMLPGGFIFMGYSESIGRLTGIFEVVRFGEFIAYRRPR